jgi:predicted deacylase
MLFRTVAPACYASVMTAQQQADRVDIRPFDLAPYAEGNTGIPYVTTLDSGKPGPHVMVNALTHGNELCGAYALKFLFDRQVKPERGKLTLGFANVAAYQRFDPANPTASRFVDEDFNRLWSPAILDGPRQSAELARARTFRPLIERVDVLLDLHSMQLDSPALNLCGLAPKGRKLALRLGVPEWVVADKGHAAGPRMRDLGAFSDPASAKTALLIECGQHWRQSAVDVAIVSTLRFLEELGMVPAGFGADRPRVPTPPEKVIEVTEAVTITTDNFQFLGQWSGMEVLPKAGTPIGRDGERVVATPYDDCVLVMPTRRLKKGQTAVRLGRRVQA